ncbi:MAG: SDR family NAD(P)-dependent oxidoreductase, partial [Gammaproteobacteria bacterium]|nr:SDR family NAD(P)-dependent oxidoreductase [Gammaproteobacteria bacterium]
MSGRRIVLTGAASGIGRAIFELLDAKGDQIVALDIKPAASTSQTFIECDLSDPGAIDAAVGRIDGNIDVLLNVAGAPGTLDPLRVMQVNILGLRHLTERLLAR